jgi:predicted ester cyclase
MSSAEENKAIVRRFYEAQAKRDLAAVKEMMAPDSVDHNRLPSQAPGRKGYIQSVAEDHTAYSNLRYIIEDQMTSGDKVVSHVIARGIHDRGEFMGIAPAGKEVNYKGLIIHRISGGKIAEEWAYGNVLGDVLEQRLEQEVRERERVEQELQVARRIQQASLPKTLDVQFRTTRKIRPLQCSAP